MKIRTFLRTIALTLIFALLIQVMPVSAISINSQNTGTETESQSTGETVNVFSYTDVLSATDETILYEVEERREQSIKHFRLTDGSMVAAIYDLPVHEQSSDGTWVDIDNTIVSGSDDEGVSSLNRGNSISFANKAKDGKLLTIKTDYGKIRWSLSGITDKVKAAAYTAPEVKANNTKMAAKSISGIIRYEDVMSDVDLEYQMLANDIKENIILHSPAAAQGFTFTLDVGNKMTAKLENNCIVILNEKGEIVRTISAPYMSDAAGAVSTGITLSLASDQKSYTVTLTPDMEWLLDESRVYPVVIDPAIVDTKTGSEISSTSVSSKDPTSTKMYGNGDIRIGRESSLYENLRAALKFTLPSTLKESDMVISAHLKLIQHNYNGATGGVRINVHRITSNIPISSLTWNKLNGKYDTAVLDNQVVTDEETYDEDTGEETIEKEICWDITSTVKSWYLEGNNYGLALTSTTENSTYKYVTFYTHNHPNVTPKRLPTVLINYLTQEGVEDYLTYHNAGSSTMGDITIGDFNGNLTYAYTDLSMTGNYLPVTIQHIYNHSHRANETPSGGSMHYGFGMRLNLSQRIESSNLDNFAYALTDADGTVHYFSTKSGTLGEAGSVYEKLSDPYTTLTINQDGTYTLSDGSNIVYKFTRYGYLKSITDEANEKSMTITYSGSLMTSIKDGAGRTTTFTFDSNNYLTEIKDPAGRRTTYKYTNGCLTQITRPDQTTVKLSYTYTDGAYMLTGIEDIDGSKIAIGYHTNSPHRVASLTEYGTQGGEGEKLTWTYSSSQTTVTDRDGNSETMMFDNAGHTICVCDGEGNAVYGKYADTTGNTNINNKHSLEYQSQMQSTVTNYLKNHHFNSGTSSWGIYGVSSNGTFGQSSTQKYEGNSAHFVNNNSSAYFGMYQNVPVPDVAGQTLTLSAYMAVDTTQSVTPDYVHMSIQYQTTDGVWTGGLNAVPITGTDWQRYSCTVKVPENALNDTVKVVIRLNYRSGGLFVDNVQLEPGSVANRYNMLENGHIAETTGQTSIYGWTNMRTSTSTDMTVAGRSGSGFKIEGVPGKSIYLYQDINVPGNEGDTFVVGGWGKGNPIPFESTYPDIDRYFGFHVKFYTDSENSQDEVLTFDAKSSDWQYLTGSISAPCDYQFVRILMWYRYQDNTCVFDDIQMYREPFGTKYTYDSNGRLLTEENILGQVTSYTYVNDTSEEISRIDYHDGTYETYTYDSDMRVIEYRDIDGNITNYEYDEDGNLIEASQEAYGETITSGEVEYSSNYILSETDSLGNTVFYNYDENKGVLLSATDAAKVTTNYTYDQNNDNLLTVTTKNSTNHYTYEKGRIKTISHNTTGASPDVVYTFQYDEFGNDTATFVGNQRLSLNQYEAHNGNLIKTTYGNNDYTEFEYDSLDRVSSVSYNGIETYGWDYAADGNVGIHYDHVNNVTWRYDYNLNGAGTNVVGSNGTRFRYVYDNSNGNLVTAKTTVNGTTKTTTYLYSPTSQLTGVAYSDGSSVGYTYDGFDRTSGTTVSNGTNTILSTTYTYLAALDENETTELISTLKNQVGNWSSELSYTYDSRGNIETISENGTQKVRYHYDELNQLIREDNIWNENKTITYTYDNGGNILSVKEYAYTTADNLSSIAPDKTHTYTYDNEWKDKLASYNGNAITYDEIGNPETYKGYTYTWQNGRELAGISGNGLNASYKYNADGIRTSKTVDGKTTTYTLEGTDVVYETNGTDSIWYNYDASGALVSMTYNGTAYYYVTNLQGDVVALTDSNRNVVVNYIYDSWGKPVSTTGSEKDTIGVINPYRYRSYRYDIETGLYYLQSRYYNPEMKRFINADVYVDTGDTTLSTNMFAYCENNPIYYIDSYGYGPSLKVFVSLHNAVLRDAMRRLKTKLKLSCITQKATYKNKTGGIPNGYMDIFCKKSKEVWEVKRNNARGIKAGNKQLNRYTSSYVRLSKSKVIKPSRGRSLSGKYKISEGIWDITYHFDNGLILYDYTPNEGRMATAGAVAIVLLILTVASQGSAAPSWAVAFA